jgi:hypothetical protein
VEPDDRERCRADVYLGDYFHDPGHVVTVQKYEAETMLPQGMGELVLEVVGVAGLDGVLEAGGCLLEEAMQPLQERRQ